MTPRQEQLLERLVEAVETLAQVALRNEEREKAHAQALRDIIATDTKHIVHDSPEF